MHTFRSTHSNLIVYVDALRKKKEDLTLFDLNAPAGHIKFAQEGTDEQRRPMGVFRTADDALAGRIRELIAYGQIPAWEEDEEEARAVSILRKRREAAAAKVAAAASA